MEMKKMTYYIVEVAYADNNSIHRAIAHHYSDGHVTLWGSYEAPLSRNINNLSHFEVVKELKEMKESFPNQYKTPERLREIAGGKE